MAVVCLEIEWFPRFDLDFRGSDAVGVREKVVMVVPFMRRLLFSGAKTMPSIRLLGERSSSTGGPFILERLSGKDQGR
ncbi:hypothetical protein KIN20_022022 [Parelaphostrongylus tenuis]|uniref:Uncharacterized protein n=1 Tax=Parelaphostrongylus tenuis TaxID=148309 RepID=A0AAD5QUX8_PARTN|nr:hypothetical protein KIN20_022022 [Parelaphostrongylus tenuis]